MPISGRKRSGRAPGHDKLCNETCTVSPRWLRVSLRTRIMPRSGRERDGVTSSISLTTLSVSPGRVGLGQLISPPLPMIPPLKRQAGLDE